MKKRKSCVSIILFLCFSSSLALANGLNLNSLGTRALAMGGAFVGLADDFSTIYWNPAGMAFFSKKYFGFYGTDVIPTQEFTLDVNIPPVVRLVPADTETKHYLSGLAAYYHPVSEKVVVGFGVYVPSGLGASWDGADFKALSNNNELIDWRSKIGLITFSPGIAFQVSEKLAVGATFNVNYGLFNLSMHAGTEPNPAPPPAVIDLGQYEDSMKGWGYGATIGILFKPIDKLSVGATYRSASTVKFKGESTISGMAFLGLSGTSDTERNVTWPMWLAVGAAFQPVEGLTLTGDLQWTQWSKIDVIETTFVDPYWAAMMEQSGDDLRPMNWDDALQIRFGAEYRFDKYALRAGYYYDPSPAPATTLNVLLPSYDFHVVTAGFGYSLNGLQLDFGIEYLMGMDRSVPFNVVTIPVDPYFTLEMPAGYETAMPGAYKMSILVPTISISYRF
jgi:long-chain fatty acid transport protein